MIRYETTIKMHHTDAAGLLFFGHQFALMHEAYEKLFEAAGFSFAILLKEKDFFLPIVHAEADYKKPLFVGDPLIIEVRIDNIGKTSFTLTYQLLNGSKNLVGAGKTVHVSTDKKTRQTCPLPADLRRALTKAV